MVEFFSDKNEVVKSEWETLSEGGEALPESPIEDIFEEKLIPSLDRDNISYKRQMEIDTICGKFRLDFAILHNRVTLGIECDGKDYHEEEFDLWRDALIIGTGTVKDIVRITGRQIYKYPYGCLYQIMQIYPYLFSSKGQKRITSLAINEFREELISLNYREKRASAQIEDTIAGISEKDIEFFSYITSRRRDMAILTPLLLFANKNRGLNIKELIEKYKQEFS